MRSMDSLTNPVVLLAAAALLLMAVVAIALVRVLRRLAALEGWVVAGHVAMKQHNKVLLDGTKAVHGMTDRIIKAQQSAQAQKVAKGRDVWRMGV